MFANLKNKLFEEVKASPSKFQQLAQAAQAAVSSSSSTVSEPVNPNDGNFFSITEEDTPQNSPQKIVKEAQPNSVLLVPSPLTLNNSLSQINNGVNRTQRIRRLSNSSMASDVSFRLPAYESSAIYHLQSDLEISGSEHEDSASTTQLDVISKEQLHDAYRRALDKYQRSRSRYTDLAKKYRELEQDCTKARTVLVDTQDKAIRRINELREQCNLEQQAKAHLEEALRMEMDDLVCKIKSYESKLDVKNENSQNAQEATLIKLDESSSLINLNTEQNSSIIDVTSSNLEKELKEKDQKINELEISLNNSIKELEDMKKREDENSIQLAGKKLEIYAELESKEKEINDLKSYRKKFNELDTKFQQLERENSLLKKQAIELNEVKEKLKQTTAMKQDFEAKVISHDHIVKEIKRGLKERDESIEELKKTSEEKTKALTEELNAKIKLLETQNNELNLKIQKTTKAENDLKNEDSEIDKLKAENLDLKESIQRLEVEFETVKVEKEAIKEQFNQSVTLKENSDEQIEFKLVKELEVTNEQLKNENATRVKELEKVIEEKQNEIRLSEEKFSTEATNFKHKIEELNQLRIEETKKLQKQITSLKANTQSSEQKLSQFLKEKSQFDEKVEKEKAELKNQITTILSEINSMQKQMDIVRDSHSQLEKEKQALEEKIEKMHEENLQTQEGSQRWQSMVEKAENKLREVEQKLQAVETENSQIADKNSLLEENSNRLEKIINDSDNNLIKQHSIDIDMNNLRVECQNYKENIKKLEEQLFTAKNELSNFQNLKDMAEKELQTNIDSFKENDKERSILAEQNKALQAEKQNMEVEKNNLNSKITELTSSSEEMKSEIESTNKKLQKQKDKYEKLLSENKSLKSISNNLQIDINQLKEILGEDSGEDFVGAVKHLRDTLESKENQLVLSNEELCALKSQHSDEVNKYEMIIKESENKIEKETNKLTKKLDLITKENAALKEQNDSFKKELDALNNQNQARLSELEKVLKETKDHNQTLQQSVQNATDLEKKLQNYEQLKIENEYLNTLTNQLETDIRKQKEEKSKQDDEIEQFKVKLQSQQCELYVLKDLNEKTKSELLELNEKLKLEQENNKKISDQLAVASSQNISTQQDMIVYKDKLSEAEKLCGETRDTYEQIITESLQLKTQLEFLQTMHEQKQDRLKAELIESKNSALELTVNLQESKNIIEKFQNAYQENEILKDKIRALEVEASEKICNIKMEQQKLLAETSQKDRTEIENLRETNKLLQLELENIKSTSAVEISNLNCEVVSLSQNLNDLQQKQSDLENLRAQAAQLTDELEKLKAQDMANQTDNQQLQHNLQESVLIKQERDEMQQKLNKIMHEVQDVSNRNLFLEQQCENYLILEQSNERLKLANEKLSRQLDETLVSIHHNEGIQANTEFEYLKNIMFQYLTGTVNGNNETLVKVIAAVLKFSPQQTQVAIEKEHQRHSLLGQINNLL